jgi:hypothetical protein
VKRFQIVAGIELREETRMTTRDGGANGSSVEARLLLTDLVEAPAENRVVSGAVQVKPGQQEDSKWDDDGLDIDQWG